jgi:hypothetical protein
LAVRANCDTVTYQSEGSTGRTRGTFPRVSSDHPEWWCYVLRCCTHTGLSGGHPAENTDHYHKVTTCSETQKTAFRWPLYREKLNVISCLLSRETQTSEQYPPYVETEHCEEVVTLQRNPERSDLLVTLRRITEHWDRWVTLQTNTKERDMVVILQRNTEHSNSCRRHRTLSTVGQRTRKQHCVFVATLQAKRVFWPGGHPTQKQRTMWPFHHFTQQHWTFLEVSLQANTD